MAMNKAEKVLFEQALTSAALRHTASIPADLVASREKPFIVGFYPILSVSVTARAAKACSTQDGHGINRTEKTSSKHPIQLHSSEVEALQELRYRAEQAFAAELRAIDLKIEQAKAASL
ncbi:hypothetical protein D3C87_351200 [compost metagenome]